MPIAASARGTANARAELYRFSCGQQSLTGSGTLSCTVTLNEALSGGVVVSLSSNNQALTVPAEVTVAARATSATFTATATPVGTAQAVLLTASTGSISQSVSIELNADVPTLGLATSSSPSVYGHAVTFTATLSSGPAGVVTFYNGGAAIGTATINGTVAAFTTSSLTAGSHTITASWPGSSSYGSAQSAALTQVVNAAAPVITWATPAAIISGTALSSTQLDATANVAGTFAYSPAAGTVPAVGSATLSAIFTPTDATDYTTAAASVTLTVNQGTATLSLNSSSVAFGSVTLNTAATQSVILTSTGTAAVTVNSVTAAGTGFTLSPAIAQTTLTPGQTLTVDIVFDPTVAGAATGTLTVTSTSSTGATATVPLTGTGTAGSYAVDLSWDAPSTSADPVAGYNVYRAPSGGTTYALLNSSPTAQTAYTDSTVTAGQAYQYQVESVDANGGLSAPTTSVAVTIP